MAENALLEAHSSQALYVARLLERALHDNGRWTVQWGPYEVPAIRTVSDTGVQFQAKFIDLCWLGEPDAMVMLKVDGEIVSVRAASRSDQAFLITWHLASRVLV